VSKVAKESPGHHILLVEDLSDVVRMVAGQRLGQGGLDDLGIADQAHG
jgi:hypothetical protein